MCIRDRSEACDPHLEGDGLHQHHGGQGAGAAGWQLPDLPVPQPGDQGSHGTGHGVCQEVQCRPADVYKRQVSTWSSRM